MTRAEALQTAKPILFNTEMVSAILDGRKTVTRRIVKNNPCECASKVVNGICKLCDDKGGFFLPDEYVKARSPYQVGDILYVRETWQYAYELDENEQIIEETGRYFYAADDSEPFTYWVNTDGSHRDVMPWRPSIHMPKEATRIFLRVTSVRVERLQVMRVADCIKEGVQLSFIEEADIVLQGERARGRFSDVWDSTIKKSEIGKYGWNANPWVWVIEFERIEVE